MRNASDQAYQVLPKGRLRLDRLLWVTVAFTCLWGGAWFAALFLEGVSDRSRHSFVGHLRPLAAPVSVFIPAGAYVKEILVDRNETVYRGQTVALLDVSLIEAQIAHLDAQIIRDAALRECLLAHRTRPITPAPVAKVDAPTIGATPPPSGHLLAQDPQGAGLSEAGVLCNAEETALREAESAHEDALNLLRVDQALLQQLAETLQRPHVPASLGPAPQEREAFLEVDQNWAQIEQDRLRQILSVQFAQKELYERRLALQKQHNAKMREASAKTERRLAELFDKLRVNTLAYQRMQSLLKEPRILAPEGGRIVRLRRFPSGSSALEDTEFLEIRPMDRPGYQAAFLVPDTHRAFVRQGQHATIELLGLRERIPKLQAQITHFETGAGGQIAAVLSLQSDSSAELDDPANGLALRGDNTSAAIQIAFGDYNALQTVTDDIREWVAGLGRFGARLMQE